MEGRPAAPLLEGAGTARSVWVASGLCAFVIISIYIWKTITDTVILYPFLFKGIIDTF